MSGARDDPPPASSGPGSGLPALVLRCRPVWRLAYGGSALALLGLGTSALAAHTMPGAPEGITLGAAVAFLLLGAGCMQFFLRFCLARLSLSDHGFRLAGPLRGGRAIAWADVREWRLARRLAGHGTLFIVHGERRACLSVPLIYEDGHLLEIGLGQRRFPVW